MKFKFIFGLIISTQLLSSDTYIQWTTDKNVKKYQVNTDSITSGVSMTEFVDNYSPMMEVKLLINPTQSYKVYIYPYTEVRGPVSNIITILPTANTNIVKIKSPQIKLVEKK